jgi:hypothetical protein
MNKVLDTTEFVVKNSDLVKINHGRFVEFSDVFDHGAAKHWLSAAPFDFSHFGDEEKLHFIIIFNALSFCYWGEPKWTVEYNGKVYDGAWGMILALGRAIDEGVRLIDFEYCSKISKEDFFKILRGNVEFPSFFDTSSYKGKEICFYKRAQLLVADIYQVFDARSFGALKNVDKLTACADYKLPQILRKLGVLEYESSLAERVDGKKEIAHNSSEEIEIRANTIWAVEFITEEVKKRSPGILSFEVNDHLWLATQEKFIGDKPYHRTRTTAY